MQRVLRARTSGALLMTTFLLLAPVVAASPAPALYFLKDGSDGPIGPGILNATVPGGLDPSTRPVLLGNDLFSTAVFAGDGSDHPDRLLGPVYVGLWMGPSIVIDANITAVLYDVAPGGDRTALASASLHLNTNESDVPDPMSLVPPDPTDPEAAAAYVAGQVLAALTAPPMLFILGFIDVELEADHDVELGFFLEASDDGPGVPLAVAATIQYDGQLMPSFLYAPWYAPDPEPTQRPTTTSPPTSSGPPTTLGTGSTTGGGDSEDSPGFGLVALLAGVAAAAVLVRRRL